jgi:hypothetical protein
MNRRAELAMQPRVDMSQCMVHLTRDDKDDWDEGGGTARDNFESILTSRSILAVRPHCLHGPRLALKAHREKFKVSCFTETPLDQLKHLLNIRRQIDLEAYGFVFERDFMLQNGAQQALYINEYHSQIDLRAAYDTIFEIAAKKNFKGKMWKTLPLVNAMHDGYDFAWEREWRMMGSLKFQLDDLVCVILPEDETMLRKKMAAMGIAAVDPEWKYERVVAELSSQQRLTRKIWKEKLQIPKPKLAKIG